MNAAAQAIAPLLHADKPALELTALRDEFIHNPEFARYVGYFGKLSTSPSAEQRELAFSVLMNLSGSRLVKPDYKKQATGVVDNAFANSANAVPLLHAVVRTHAEQYSARVRAMLSDKNPEISTLAAIADQSLHASTGAMSVAGKSIDSMKYEDVVASVLKDKGNPTLGHELFQRQGCIACHTVSTKEPQKGPMLGGIAGRYNRSELCESIMKPSAKIAQGFETQWFKTSDGDVLDGFVSRESGDEVEVHNATGQAFVLKKANILRRGKRDFSIMPEGLVAKLTPADLASLIAYLESTTGK